MKHNPPSRWGLLWRSHSKLEGTTEFLIYQDLMPALFLTRKEAREFADEHYGYIRTRADLRAEPHGWKMPIPVRVCLSIERAP